MIRIIIFFLFILNSLTSYVFLFYYLMFINCSNVILLFHWYLEIIIRYYNYYYWNLVNNIVNPSHLKVSVKRKDSSTTSSTMMTPTAVATITSSTPQPIDRSNRSAQSLVKRSLSSMLRNGSEEDSSRCSKKDYKTSTESNSRFTIYKVNKASRKKREKSSARKERKATKTLAIVLGKLLLDRFIHFRRPEITDWRIVSIIHKH